jgi:hypothetical protein
VGRGRWREGQTGDSGPIRINIAASSRPWKREPSRISAPTTSMGWALKDRDVMIGDEVDGDIYIEDERKRQAEKEDIRTVAGKRELIRTFLNRVRDELLEIVPNMPEEWDGHELSWLVTEKFAFEQLTAKFACTDDAAWRERVRAFNNERLVRNL